MDDHHLAIFGRSEPVADKIPMVKVANNDQAKALTPPVMASRGEVYTTPAFGQLESATHFSKDVVHELRSAFNIFTDSNADQLSWDQVDAVLDAIMGAALSEDDRAAARDMHPGGVDFDSFLDICHRQTARLQTGASLVETWQALTGDLSGNALVDNDRVDGAGDPLKGVTTKGLKQAFESKGNVLMDSDGCSDKAAELIFKRLAPAHPEEEKGEAGEADRHDEDKVVAFAAVEKLFRSDWAATKDESMAHDYKPPLPSTVVKPNLTYTEAVPVPGQLGAPVIPMAAKPGVGVLGAATATPSIPTSAKPSLVSRSAAGSGGGAGVMSASAVGGTSKISKPFQVHKPIVPSIAI